MSNITTLRISEKNLITNQIKTAKYTIEHSRNTILRYRQSENGDIWKSHIEKLQVVIKDKTDDLLKLEDRITMISAGKLDDELLSVLSQNKNEVSEKNKIEKTKKNLIEVDKKQRKDTSQAYYDNENSHRRKDRYLEKDKDRAEQHFLRVCSNIPDHILKKLDNMPNNKGYIWKDVYCYGRLPDDNSGVTTVFEKKKDLLTIHEWSKKTDTYCVYEKYGNNRKVLKSVKPRSIISKK